MQKRARYSSKIDNKELINQNLFNKKIQQLNLFMKKRKLINCYKLSKEIPENKLGKIRSYSY